MKSIWAGIGFFGGLCFLTMGLPVLLAVGATGFLSVNVWLTLAVALAGLGGLAAYMIRHQGCENCQGGDETKGLRHILHRKPVSRRSW